MAINPLREAYGTTGLLPLRSGLPYMPRSLVFEVSPNGLKLAPLVLQTQCLERLHEFLTMEPREQVRCKMPHAPPRLHIVPLVRRIHPTLHGVDGHQQSSIAICD